MKKILLLAMVAIFAISCGSQKRALEAQNQLLQQQLAQGSTQEGDGIRPGRTARVAEPCEELALEESENLRDFGTSIANIEKVARNEALRDARNKLAQSLQVAVEGAARDYEQNANSELKTSTEALSESVNSQYVTQYVANTKAIKWSVYDLADGSIQVYVCVEMAAAKEEVLKDLSNKLDRDGVIEVKADRDRFVEQISSGLERSKEEQRAQM